MKEQLLFFGTLKVANEVSIKYSADISPLENSGQSSAPEGSE